MNQNQTRTRAKIIILMIRTYFGERIPIATIFLYVMVPRIAAPRPMRIAMMAEAMLAPMMDIAIMATDVAVVEAPDRTN